MFTFQGFQGFKNSKNNSFRGNTVYQKKPFETWQFRKIGVLVNFGQFSIQKLKSKNLVCLSVRLNLRGFILQNVRVGPNKHGGGKFLHLCR